MKYSSPTRRFGETQIWVDLAFQREEDSQLSAIQSKKGRSPPRPTLSKQAINKKINEPEKCIISPSDAVFAGLSRIVMSWVSSSSSLPSLGVKRICEAAALRLFLFLRGRGPYLS